MPSIAFIVFLLLWIVWLTPFSIRRRGGGQRAAVVAPAARWGIILQGIGMGVAWIHRPFWTTPSAPRVVIALALEAIACIISWTAVSALGKQWRFDAALGSEHDLIQSGPYAFLRHPIYASMLLMLLSACSMMSNWITFPIALALEIVGIEIRIRTEEHLLAGRFGEQFQRYRLRVAAYIPGLR